MRLEITEGRAVKAPQWLGSLLSRVGEQSAACEGISGRFCVGVTLVSLEEMREINREQRGVDRPTDVLSFPSVRYPQGKTARLCPKRLRRELDPETGCVFLGDIVLSLERAQEQALEYGHSLRRETGFLFAHGMLHLMGYDHIDKQDRAAMREMEERIMSNINLSRELTDSDWELIDAAKAAWKNAYAPYSHYHVGACIRTADGRMFSGCNVENASFGLTICAERNAATTAAAAGARAFEAIAIYGEGTRTSPCGACRQFLREFAQEMRVILVSGEQIEVTSLSALLPVSFGPENISEVNG